MNTWKLDLSVESVKYIDTTDLTKGAKIVIGNLEKMVMPVTVKVTEENGNVQRVRIPVEVWQKGSRWTFWAPSVSRIKEIVIDPERVLPDVNRGNNGWRM